MHRKRKLVFSLEIYFAVVKGTCCFLLSILSIFSSIWYVYALPTPSPPMLPHWGWPRFPSASGLQLERAEREWLLHVDFNLPAHLWFP